MDSRSSASPTHIVILCLCWYSISSLASQVTKSILTIYPKPLFLGEFQFLYTALLASGCCYLAHCCKTFYDWFPRGTFPQYYEDSQTRRIQANTITRPTKRILLTVLPLSFFQFVGKYLGHTATSLVPISTVASIKTLSPVFIVIIQRILNLSKIRLNALIYFSLVCLVFGVWIIVGEDNVQQSVDSDKPHYDSISYSSYGVICAVASMLVFVAQNIYGKNVFTFKEEAPLQKTQKIRADSPLPIYVDRNSTIGGTKKYDKLTLLTYIPLVGFCLSFGWFMTLEFPAIWQDVQQGGLAIIPWRLFLLNGTFHFVQAMITFHLLGEVSTLTYSIANLMKRIAIITVSWAYAGMAVTMKQIFGLILNMIGLFLYERYSSQSRQEKTR